MAGLPPQDPVSKVHIVNRGNMVTAQAGSGPGRVLITQYRPGGVIQPPVRPKPSQNQNPVALKPTQPGTVIERVLIKACTKAPPKKDKTFSLRHLDTAQVSSITALKKEIVKQLCEDIIDWEEFDIGYMPSSDKVIYIRSKEDLVEVYKDVLKGGDKVKLWCDGLRASRKRSRTEDEQEVSGKAKKKSSVDERADKVQEYFDLLKGKHGCNFTEMQYRIWSEMLVSGMHKDTDKAPQSSMFKRAGGNTPVKQKDNSGQTATQAALTQMSAALVACSSRQNQSGSSPASKVIENRSKCYKQIAELQNLKAQGFLEDEDFEREHNAIMDILKSLAK